MKVRRTDFPHVKISVSISYIGIALQRVTNKVNSSYMPLKWWKNDKVNDHPILTLLLTWLLQFNAFYLVTVTVWNITVWSRSSMAIVGFLLYDFSWVKPNWLKFSLENILILFTNVRMLKIRLNVRYLSERSLTFLNYFLIGMDTVYSVSLISDSL